MANEVPHEGLVQNIAGNVTPLDLASNAVVLVYQSPPGIDKTDSHTTAEDDFKLSFDFAGSPEVVRVDECDQRGASGLPTSVSRGCYAGVLLGNQGNSTVNSRVSLYNRSRAVAGAVVYDDDFQVPVRLAPDASHCVVEGSFGIIGRDHDAYQM
jgi:hypothetical protein